MPASRSAAVRAATAVPMTRNPASSQPIRAGLEQRRLAGSGLADHQVVAVARGEQCPHTVGLFAIEMGMEPEDPFDHARGRPGRFLRRCVRPRRR